MILISSPNLKIDGKPNLTTLNNNIKYIQGGTNKKKLIDSTA